METTCSECYIHLWCLSACRYFTLHQSMQNLVQGLLGVPKAKCSGATCLKLVGTASPCVGGIHLLGFHRFSDGSMQCGSLVAHSRYSLTSLSHLLPMTSASPTDKLLWRAPKSLSHCLLLRELELRNHSFQRRQQQWNIHALMFVYMCTHTHTHTTRLKSKGVRKNTET